MKIKLSLYDTYWSDQTGHEVDRVTEVSTLEVEESLIDRLTLREIVNKSGRPEGRVEVIE